MATKVPRAGLFGRISERMRPSGPFFPILFCGLWSIACAQKADFIIVERPSALNVFDRYETALSSSRRNALPRWAPFQIIEKETVLGDRITSAAHVRLGGDDYYLLLDEDGGYAGAEEAGRILRRANLTLHGDTATVGRKNALRFAEGYLSGGTRSTLSPGTTLLRAFVSGGRWYCCRLDNPRSYGWCSGPAAAFAVREETAPAEEMRISPHVSRRIIRRMETANSTYSRYFEYFNSRTGQSKSAPRWDMEQEPDVLRFTLKVSAGVDLHTSSDILAREIGAMVRGEELDVERDGNVIEVRVLKK